MKNFGGIMKQQMLKKGIKQEVLAHQLNIARTTVTAYCNNKRQPDLETLSRICNLLEINLAWLFEQPNFDNSDMYLHDDFEVKVNHTCRKVSHHKRQRFLEGVNFLMMYYVWMRKRNKKKKLHKKIKKSRIAHYR